MLVTDQDAMFKWKCISDFLARVSPAVYNRGASQAQHDMTAAGWNVKGEQRPFQWVSVDTVFCWKE